MEAIDTEIKPTKVKVAEKTLIELLGVEKTYQLSKQTIHALRGIDFSIQAGQFIAIAGPSGSGKTSFLNLVALIDTPSKGVVKYDGVNIQEFNDNQITKFRNRKIGIVFQNYNLIPVFNSVENVAFAMQLQSISKKESTERAKAILFEVGLGNHMNQRPGELSGGQQQRVSIARALVTNPEIVIADEPTAALDSKTGMEIINLMKELNKSKKTTFLFSTHDTRIIKNVSRVLYMEDGKLKN